MEPDENVMSMKLDETNKKLKHMLHAFYYIYQYFMHMLC